MNQSKEINFASRRWVIVAGTGITEGKLKISYSEELAAKAVGKALAKYGCGLVSGGWEVAAHRVCKWHLNNSFNLDKLIQKIFYRLDLM